MHDHSVQGNDFFKCDFCHKPWADDRPMVEGHQGALICSQCLTPAYVDIVHAGGGKELVEAKCSLCLEARPEAKWASPLFPETIACRRCIKQCAGVLEHDEDHNWKRPAAGPGALAPTTEDDHEDE